MARVMVALDGSSLAEQAIPQALARMRAEDQLILLRVVEVPATGTTLDWVSDHTSQAESYLQRIAAPLLRDGTKVDTVVRSGSASDEIRHTIDERHVDLLVLAPHGGGGWKSRLMGTVAKHVVRRAHCPVWIARCEAEKAPAPPAASTVLITLDTSRLAEKALQFARAWLQPPTRAILLGATDRVPGGQQLTVQQLGDYLDEQVRHLSAAGWTVDSVVEDGYAGQCILRVAAREKVDLIVMATHGRTGLARFAMGSVAEQVLDEAACPVALINARAEAIPEPTETEVLLGTDG